MCRPSILINSVFKLGKNSYPEIFLEECKYKTKERENLLLMIQKEFISSDDDSKEGENFEESIIRF